MSPSANTPLTVPLHSIHCRGYRGTGQPWDHRDCDCGATIHHLINVISEMDRQIELHNQRLLQVINDLRALAEKGATNA